MAEDNCDCKCCMYPPCPKCGKGYLVPFSFKDDVYEKWKCTECKHELKKRE